MHSRKIIPQRRRQKSDRQGTGRSEAVRGLPAQIAHVELNPA